MARPLTTGPTIGFRLPLDLHAILVARAAARGETPAAYVRRNLIRTLTNSTSKEDPE